MVFGSADGDGALVLSSLLSTKLFVYGTGDRRRDANVVLRNNR